MLGRGFHTLIKNVSFSSPTDVGSHNPPPSKLNDFAGIRSFLQSMWDPQSTPLRDPTSLLAHHLMSGSASSLAYQLEIGSDTIGNSSSPPLTNIVLFGLSLSDFPSRFSSQPMWDLTIHPPPRPSVLASPHSLIQS